VLSLRERAISAANEALSVGRGRVLGANMVEVAASRLIAVRRAQRALKAAMGTERLLLSEADDAALTAALARVDRIADDLEADVARYRTALPPA